jgi:hypothetical protein
MTPKVSAPMRLAQEKYEHIWMRGYIYFTAPLDKTSSPSEKPSPTKFFP